MKVNFLLNVITKSPYNLSQAKAVDLLCDLLKCSREDFWLSLDSDYSGSPTKLQQTFKLLENQYPLPYLLQKKYFLGTEFYVDERVLIPRDETEGLVKLAIQWLTKHPKAKIVDVGTGSGAIGLTLKKAFPQSSVWLTDNSWEALQVAQKNAQRHHLEVSFLLGNFLQPLQDLVIQPNVLIINPPYVDRDGADWAPALKFEPAHALFAPNKGLFFYQKLFKDLRNVFDYNQPTILFLEIGYNQKPALEALIDQASIATWFKINFYRDLNQHWRYLVLEMNYNVDCFTN